MLALLFYPASADLSIIACKENFQNAGNGCRKSHVILSYFMQPGPDHEIECEHNFSIMLNKSPIVSILQSTPDNSNLQGKLKMVRVIGSSSYRELRKNDRKYVKNGVHCI